MQICVSVPVKMTLNHLAQFRKVKSNSRKIWYYTKRLSQCTFRQYKAYTTQLCLKITRQISPRTTLAPTIMTPETGKMNQPTNPMMAAQRQISNLTHLRAPTPHLITPAHIRSRQPQKLSTRIPQRIEPTLPHKPRNRYAHLTIICNDRITASRMHQGVITLQTVMITHHISSSNPLPNIISRPLSYDNRTWPMDPEDFIREVECNIQYQSCSIPHLLWPL